MTADLCRDCCTRLPRAETAERCPACGSPRLLRHAELHDLTIAHIDCDAFYAAVEKRDDPTLRDRPVIVGGGRRGVVAACCYIARTYGVHSAMPMFQARKACPDAVVIRPDMKKYMAVGREIRALMRTLTPLVEPLSIDEAFLDLSGTQRLHQASPAETLARLCRQIEAEIGLTASVGLSYNKFLAKIASDLDKPRGFAVIGRAEAKSFLADKPLRMIWGVGPALDKKLATDGLRHIGQLTDMDEDRLVARYGSIGRRLARFARGQDERRVVPDQPTKSISAETTFDEDIASLEELLPILWRLAEKVSGRLKAAGLAGRSVILKLKTADFRTLTRSHALDTECQLAEDLYQTAAPLLATACDGRTFRLIGVGVSALAPAGAEPAGLLDGLDKEAARGEQVERVIDQLRESFGEKAVVKGRALGGRKGSGRRSPPGH